MVYDLFYEGGTTEISAAAYLSDGSKIFDRDITYYFTSDNTEVASIDGNTMSTLKEGEATITAYVTFNGIEKTVSKKIKVVSVSLERIEAHTEDNIVSSIDKDGSQIVVKGINNDGSEGNIEGASYVYENLTPDLIDLSEGGKVFSIARGAAQVKVIMTLGGLSFECIADVISSSQKTEPTLYTYEMRQNALYNISKYDWAKSSKDSAVRDAEYWVENLEAVYDSIMYEGIPRAYSIGLHDSPDDFDYKCAYCQEDVRNHATLYGWKTNPLVRPFKIQCPACKRFFPSNDFESFYKLGLDQKRQFDRTRALEAHRAMLLEKGEILPELEISEERRTAIDSGLALTKEERAYYGYGKGYLKNNTYRDAVNDGVMLLDHVYDSAGNIVKEGVLLAEEDLDTYAVDDGMGWNIGLTADSGIPIMKTFIPFYHHAMYSINGSVYLTKALPALMDAYLYTGDIKYGRAGAILIDRIADVFPSFDLTQWVEYQNSHGGRNTGKILGAIWQSGLAETFIKSYDAFYPAMDDPYVIQFLSKKAAEFGLENPKLTGDMIRENCENGIVRESFKGAKEDKIQGNFGMHQMVVTCAAVALDTFPETQEMLDWLMARSSTGKTTVSNYGVYVDGVYKPRTFGVYTSNTGGEIGIYLVNQVDRDGFGYEIGAGGQVVGFGIVRVGELPRQKAAGEGAGQLLRLLDGTGHTIGALSEHQLGAVGLHQNPPLHAHGLRHDDNGTVAPSRRHAGKADAGIAGGRFDDDGAGLQNACRLRFFHHVFGNAVLGGAAGVEGFHLGQKLGFQMVFGRIAVQRHQRCTADELGNGRIDTHRRTPLQMEWG